MAAPHIVEGALSILEMVFKAMEVAFWTIAVLVGLLGLGLVGLSGYMMWALSHS